jgi:hypothetical protein
MRVWVHQAELQLQFSTWGLLAALLLASTWVTAHTDLLSILDRIWVQVGFVLFNGLCTAGLTYALGPILGFQGALMAVTAPALLVAVIWPLLARPLLVHRAPVPQT